MPQPQGLPDTDTSRGKLDRFPKTCFGEQALAQPSILSKVAEPLHESPRLAFQLRIPCLALSPQPLSPNPKAADAPPLLLQVLDGFGKATQALCMRRTGE